MEHLWPTDEAPPYAKLWGLALADIEELPTHLPHWRLRGASGWGIFRTAESTQSAARAAGAAVVEDLRR